VSKYGYGGNFFVVINAFNDLSKFTDADVLLTGIPGFLVIATTGISSVIGCLFAAAVTNKGIKGAWVEAVVFGISLLVPMVSGGRMGTFGCLVSFIAVFVLIQERAGKITGFNQIRLKSVSLVLAGFAGVLIIFYLSQLAIGREEDGDLINHVLIYLAAPIKNLDIQLSAVIPESSRFGQYSFPGFYATIANKISYDPSILLQNRHPFVFYNGENLGNVYTVFRDLYIDFHFFGTVIAVAIMAAVSQTVYECAKRFSLLSLCIYFYISFNVMMSFFSDNFFAVLVSTQPIKWLMTVLPVVIVIYLLRKPEDSLEDSLEDSSYQEFSLNGTIDKSVRLGNVAEC
jgi:oligosaccharide repeat unit polymerase